MSANRLRSMMLVVFLGALFFGCLDAHSANPRDRIDYWQSNYKEISNVDPLAKRAHAVFSRVLKAAGTRRGVVPRLFIIKYDSLEVSAIPDGWIILSQAALQLCYKGGKHGDDRLAFILGHEIAHQLKDDFWHVRFFQAIRTAKNQDKSDTTLAEVRKIAALTDQVLSKELQADEYGAVYAVIAGFDMSAIVKEDNSVNFFAEWVRALDPTRVAGSHKDSTHPSPAQRAETVKARLRQVVDHIDYFRIGMAFYQAGNFHRAILSFQKFLSFFPSREVYHNLAACHHQLALQFYNKWKGASQAIPFRLSLSADPETRAKKIHLRGGGNSENKDNKVLFENSINQAIELYETAISQDPDYLRAYENLASALILKGEYYKAIGVLKDALKKNPQDAAIYNNLGVAFYYAENSEKARESFLKAQELDASNNIALFNLGQLMQLQGKEEEAKKFWLSYLKRQPVGIWSTRIREKLKITSDQKGLVNFTERESVSGVQIGDYEDELPTGLKRTESKKLVLEESPYNLVSYSNGIGTLSLEEEIILITLPDNYPGKSQRGIRYGASMEEVHSAYGEPTEVLELPMGEVWVYRKLGISFRFDKHQVIAWLLF